MIKKTYLQTFDVISVLLYSLLANYIFDFKHLDFGLKLDVMALFRFFLLTISATVFNIMLLKLKAIEKEAADEFFLDFNQYQQKMLNIQSASLPSEIPTSPIESIDKRFDSYFKGTEDNEIKGRQRRIYSLLLIAVITFVLFFLAEPLWNIVNF